MPSYPSRASASPAIALMRPAAAVDGQRRREWRQLAAALLDRVERDPEVGTLDRPLVGDVDVDRHSARLETAAAKSFGTSRREGSSWSLPPQPETSRASAPKRTTRPTADVRLMRERRPWRSGRGRCRVTTWRSSACRSVPHRSEDLVTADGCALNEPPVCGVGQRRTRSPPRVRRLRGDARPPRRGPSGIARARRRCARAGVGPGTRSAPHRAGAGDGVRGLQCGPRQDPGEALRHALRPRGGPFEPDVALRGELEAGAAVIGAEPVGDAAERVGGSAVRLDQRHPADRIALA